MIKQITKQMTSILWSVLGVIIVSSNIMVGQSRTPWEMNRGGSWSYLGFSLSSHGEISAYNNAVIPSETDPNWGPAPNPETIGFSEASILPGNCLSSVDYTYFQTYVNVPTNTTVTQFTIAFSGIDDGGRVTIFNSANPGGIVVPGSYVYLGGTGTANLASYVTTGQNRVVVTQVDDCPVGNNLQSASVVLNGQTIAPPIATVQTLTMLGGNGAIGDIDPYIDASLDGGQTWGPAYLTGWHPWGFVPGTNSWVNFDPNNQVGLNSTTDYRIQFYIPSTFTNPTMTFQLKADNEGIVSINGTQVADVVGQGGGPVPDLTVNQALHTGLNEITVQLIDWGGIVGLNYSVVLTMISDQGFELQPAENVSNQAPVADAGTDQSFTCEVGPTVNVSLDGSASSDPDGDALTYSWSDGTLEVSTAASFTKPLVGGTHAFTLTVSDGQATATDEVIVTVELDQTAPVLAITGANSMTIECPIAFTDPGATATDNCDSAPAVTAAGIVDNTTPGAYTITYTATDAAGNTSTAVRTVNVVDTTPPTVTASLAPVDGKVKEDKGEFFVEFTATDGCSNVVVTAELNGVPVTNGQKVKLKIDDEEKVKEKKGKLEIKAPSFELVVTGTDASGNGASASAVPVFADDEDHDDDDDKDHDEDDDDDDDDDDDGKEERDGHGDRLMALTPDAYSLSQNYPNPFNPITHMVYTLPEDGVMTLTVYDMSGKAVATLVNGHQSAGRHQITFDASALSSGTYLYVMKTGSFREVKKMIFLK